MPARIWGARAGRPSGWPRRNEAPLARKLHGIGVVSPTTRIYLEGSTMTSTATSARSELAVHYRTARINDLDIFYREAGPQNAPALLLLHGFPTSSNMFRNLIPRLATTFHVVAPDYPGF